MFQKWDSHNLLESKINNRGSQKKTFIILFFCMGFFVFIALKFEFAKYTLKALTVSIPGEGAIGKMSNVSLDDVKRILGSSEVLVLSSTKDPIGEIQFNEQGIDISDSELGFNKSLFIAKNRWATVRYLGPNPAGAGLVGAEQEAEQVKFFGTKTDSIPVVTTAVTIQKMMDGYFSPLLKSLDYGQDILDAIHVNAAYYSPDYNNQLIKEKVIPSVWNNAFVVGFQNLFIYPSSCFIESTNYKLCPSEILSAGHDPTVISHELTHVIYNHLMDSRIPAGFQWNAVNEGLADYFSAVFHKEPVLGKVWKVKHSQSGYMRRLIDVRSASENELYEEFHKLSNVFSSALWRAREAIIAEETLQSNGKKDSIGFEFDRMVLNSIRLAGATNKTRLGDAGTAILRSAEMLGFPHWKIKLKTVFDESKIGFAQKFESTATTEDTRKQQSCGTVSSVTYAKKSDWVQFVFVFSLPLLVCLIKKIRIRKSVFPSIYFFCVFFAICQVLTSCTTRIERKGSPDFFGRPKQIFVYECGSQFLYGLATAAENQIQGRLKEKIFLGFYEPEVGLDGTFSKQNIMLSNQDLEKNPMRIYAIVDSQFLVIDQVFESRGKPLKLEQKPNFFSPTRGTQLAYLRLAKILLETAPQLLKKKYEGKQFIRSEIFSSSAEPIEIKQDATFQSKSGYGPIPSRLLVSNETKCELVDRPM